MPLATPLVSVIMPAYNAAAYIEQSIQSVLAQTYSHWELLVIDDGSTDNTAQLVRNIAAKDARIRYLNQKNKKQAAARNYGMRESQGQWIAFLDSDDLWEEKKLETQLEMASKMPEVDLFFTGGVNLDQTTGQVTNYEIVTGLYRGNQMYLLQYQRNYIPVLSVMLKKEWVKKVGYQDEREEISTYEDWDYWVRMSKAGAIFYGIPDSLFTYRVHPEGSSKKYILFKGAELIALYKNRDASLLPIEPLTEKLRKEEVALLPLLVINQKHRLAKKHAALLLRISPSFRNLMIFLFLWFSPVKSPNVVHFLISKK